MSPARPSHLQLLPPTTSTTYGTPCNTDADASAAPSALGVLDALFFTRGSRIYEISRQRARNVGDSLPLRPHDATRACLAAFDAHYERRGGSVATALAATYGRTLAACLVGMLLLTAITIFAPLVLQQVVLTFSAGDAHGTDKPRLGLWLAVFIASRLVKVVVSTHVSYHVNIVGMRTAATVRAVVYRKVLHKNLCTAGGRPETRPDVMNLVTTDLRTLQELALVGLNVFTLPIQIGVTTYLLYSVLNVAAFAGIAVIVTTLLVLQAAISVRRIDAFLKTPEFEASNVARGSDAADEVRSDDGAAAVCVTGGRFTWTAAAVPDTRAGRSATLQPPPVTLSGISFALEKGDFAVVYGGFVTYRIGLANGALVENARDRSAEPRGLDAEQEAQTTMTSLAPTGSHSVHRVAPTNAKRAHTKPTTDDGILIREERREEGRVADVVWRRYLDAIGGVRMLAVLLLSQLLWQGFQILSDFWLSHWTSGNRDANTSGRFSDRNLTTSTPSSVTASSDAFGCDAANDNGWTRSDQQQGPCCV
ncbi:hypothetical protein PybrP1_010108 [[Pythium] brassicae (nom. inval.)]|nr:hypothetical protein PybrP1_010108 [[Pythium] brassicae (nom. inval.)]